MKMTRKVSLSRLFVAVVVPSVVQYSTVAFSRDKVDESDSSLRIFR
jgi:hypothetical protein